jgi:hypothetical protein
VSCWLPVRYLFILMRPCVWLIVCVLIKFVSSSTVVATEIQSEFLLEADALPSSNACLVLKDKSSSFKSSTVSSLSLI